MNFKAKVTRFFKRLLHVDRSKSFTKHLERKGSRIPFSEISQRLLKTMENSKYEIGSRILVPVFYRLCFSQNDRNALKALERTLLIELRKELYRESKEYNPDITEKELTIEVLTDDDLVDGDFEVYAYLQKTSDRGYESNSNKTMIESPENLKLEVIHDNQGISDSSLENEFEKEDEQKTMIHPMVFYRLEITSDNFHEIVEVTDTKVSLGRSQKATVHLKDNDLFISRIHAKIEIKKGDLFLRSCGANGTFLNDDEIENDKHIQVFPGDRITIENYTLTILSNTNNQNGSKIGQNNFKGNESHTELKKPAIEFNDKEEVVEFTDIDLQSLSKFVLEDTLH